MDRDAPEERAKGEAVRVPPKERLEFKKFLAANPTYFGNLEKNPFKPITKIGNTTYEEITRVGFNPAPNLLKATGRSRCSVRHCAHGSR